MCSGWVVLRDRAVEILQTRHGLGVIQENVLDLAAKRGKDNAQGRGWAFGKDSP
jgi:hypothetical protein